MSSGELVALVCCDLGAIVRGRSLFASELDVALEAGVGWVPANHVLTPLGPVAEPNPFGSIGDLRLLPDSSTRIRVGGASGDRALELLLCDIVETDGSPWECCPRRFLRDVLRAVEVELGANVLASFEHEFQLLLDTPSALPFSLEAQRQAEPFATEVMNALVEAGTEPERFFPEYAAHQFEIPVAPSEGLGGADRAVVLREVVREIARGLGLRASFTPLLDPAEAGNGVHIHLNLLDADGAPLLYDAARPGCLSQLGGSFAAGILHHARALTAFTAPSPVSAARLAPHRWSAGALCLAQRNREALLRIPPLVTLGGGDPALQLHLEYRGADAAANPHLALGAILLAGLQGVRAGLPAHPSSSATPPHSTRPRRRATALVRCRNHSSIPCRRSTRTMSPGDGSAHCCMTPTRASSELRSKQQGTRISRRAAGAMPPSTDELAARLLAGIERELPAAIALRRRLHARPELAHAEEWTAATVAAAMPVECIAAAGTGRLALIGSVGAGAVAVRAELDGLPVHERTGASFSATGDTMHACGHDVHMAALVALVRAAHQLADQLPGPLLAVFQPSEEAYPSGAQELAEGELAGRSLAAVVGVHVHPELPWGTVALDPGVVNASCDLVEILVEGEPSHGAYPHHGRDPILALAQVVVALHAQVARRIDPLNPAVLTVGVIEGGSAENVIPSHARARLALRAHRSEDRRTLLELVAEVASGIAAANGCVARLTTSVGEPALENNAKIVGATRALLPSIGLGLAHEWRSCGSDDFAFFSELAPLTMAFVGLDGAEDFHKRPLHHPELLPPDAAVAAVARTQAILYLAAAGSHASPGM